MQSSTAQRKKNPEVELAEQLGDLVHNSVEFVQVAFPWGEGDLAGQMPEPWQLKILKEIDDGLKTIDEAIQEAVASGHDVGKSALVAWIILWAISTFEDTRGVVTANTATQLMTKTWPELSKWHNLFIAKHWFTVNATSIVSNQPGHEKTWRIDAIPWSITNTEAFAGLHNLGKRVVIIFDEASAIHDAIHDVTEGATTDKGTEIIWCMFGNPTRNTGRFHAAFHKLRHRWKTHQIDARTVRISNKTKIKAWAEDYGENSDFFKVRVKGEFPSVGDKQFISTALVDAARGKHLPVDQYDFAPVILTCDPAWTGGDELIIGKRQGLAFSILKVMARNDDDTLVAGFIAGYEDEYKADAVFIDLGYGTGIYSAGKHMNRNWTLVSFGAASNTPGYANKRAEMYGLGRTWLIEGGVLPDDAKLCEEIPSVEADVKMNGDIILESKDDMKERGLSSPNRADGWALSFAFPVRKKVRNDPVRRQETSEPKEGYKVFVDV